jgi:RNA polymerase sigma-70 factor (ECF subfamily)
VFCLADFMGENNFSLRSFWMAGRAAPAAESAAGLREREDLSDRSLLRRFRSGQRDAATLLYLRYAGQLHALAQAQSSPDLARRVDPEDIVQSVFRTFFRRAVQGHYDVPEGEELWKLFLVIALNKIRATGAYHRAGKRDVRRTVTGTRFDQLLQTQAGRDEAALQALQQVIDEILDQLPASHRAIVELRIEGFTVHEIARKTERSKRSAERALQEFRRQLSALIQEP